jgi:carotenoid cleavage dioxygenase-like enzyme
MCRLRVLLIACGAAAAQDDIGFEGLFKNVVDEVESFNLNVTGQIPDYVVGAMAQTGPARWSWGKRKFTHALDGFGKLHKFEFKGGNQVTFASKFLQSGFHTEAQKINDIPVGVFAQPTDPPHPDGMMHMEGFIKAPNDNNQVNVIQLEKGHFEVLSDTLAVVEVDPVSLNLTNEYANMACGANAPEHCTQMKNVSNPFGQMCAGASAHPFVLENGDYLGLREITRFTSIIPEKESFAVYRISKDQRGTLQDMIKIPVKRASYTHSFGLAKATDGMSMHVIVAQQPIHYNSMAIATSHTLQKGFWKGKDVSSFHVAPLEFGAEPIEIESPDQFFFGHTVNTYANGFGKFVMDINIQNNIFFDRYSLDVLFDKTRRDAWTMTEKDGVKPGYQTVTRYYIDMFEKTVTSKPLFGRAPEENIYNEHDLFRLHPEDYGKPYCGYWAWQAYYNSTSFGSWAVVRTELCGDKGPVVAAAWHQPNVYPGEASFVPKPGSKDRTEGTLIFHAYNGALDRSYLVVADAKTMKTIAQAELPVNIPFTVHGNWFPAASEASVIV